MKQKQQPKTRGETRRDLLEDFHKMLRAMVVIDQQAKGFIVQRYMSAITRLSEEIPERRAGNGMVGRPHARGPVAGSTTSWRTSSG